MKYLIRFARNSDIDNIQHETVHAESDQQARAMFTICDCYVYSCERVDNPDRDNADLLRAAKAAGFENATLTNLTRAAYSEAPEPDWMAEARAREADAKDLLNTQENLFQ